jgi:protoheme IX farnesyltransferase
MGVTPANGISHAGADVKRSSARRPAAPRLHEFLALTKPRVVSLIVFTAMIGMFLATPGVLALQPFAFGVLGIALVAGSAAAVNCLLEQKIDALMTRTRGRPLPRGQLTSAEALAFAAVVGAVGLALLYSLVNPLTMWLSLATFVGYAFVYTVILKPRTPQNIVIGGAAGAMPPVLGWAAVTGAVSADALLLFLIIFAWTPPHFWALALYRRNEYAKAGVPMLPVTHGERYTRRHVLLYTLILLAVSVLPFCTRMSGLIYGASAVVLGGIFVAYAARLYASYSNRLAHTTFRYSIVYLALLFAALLVDHYFLIRL